jgi:Tol biopolymer transport system component
MTTVTRTTATALVAVAVAVALGVARLSAQTGEDLFQKALTSERATGDLPAAIALYERIANQFGGDRPLMARTLLQLGECYQKLGDPRAPAVFDRLIREFPERTGEVTAARARIALVAPTSIAKGDRVIWSGPRVDPFGRISADGGLISFVDWNDGRLMLHDVATNADRALTPAAPNYSEQAEWSVVSRDGKHVAYVWLSGDREQFRIAQIPATGFIAPRTLNEEYFTSMDWSPDGASIAAVKWLKDRTGQIGVISVADGAFRGLKWIPATALARASSLTTLAFSPDGRYIAFDLPVDAQQQRDVFILAADGSREIPAVIHGANDAVVGWSPDGTRLLFSSDRTGSVGLWGQPFAGGKLSGSPELLKADIGAGFALGVGHGGALYFHKIVSTRDVVIATIDLRAGKLVTPPVAFTQGFATGVTNPVWSTDGKSLAYPVSCTGGCTAIRTIATGQVRRVAGTLTSARGPQWSPDGRSLLVSGKDANARDGIFQVDAQTGQVTPLVRSAGLSAMALWSPDGQKIYFNRDGAFVERNLATGTERLLSRDTGERYGTLSPDGQSLVVAHQDAATGSATLLLVPVAGGNARTVFRVAPREGLFRPGTGSWLPDSSALIVQKYTGSRWELWLVPITGQPARRLDIDPELWREGSGQSPRPGVMQGDTGFSLSPDGRQIAFMKGKTAAEVWALENFLPAVRANR